VSDTERARVGETLDLLRDVLAPYVDAAMTEAYGDAWDDRVADEDAKRRTNGRRLPVSKRDLAVLLKSIQFERIAPWWNPSERPDPRLKSFASEVLTLRNLFAHGDDCHGEHARLVDTAKRLLRLLDLVVPERWSEAAESTGGQAVAVPSVAVDPFVEEINRLGPTAERLIEIWQRVGEITVEYTAFLAAGSPAGAEELQALRENVGGMGDRVLDLLVKVDELDGAPPDSEEVRVLIVATRSQVVSTPLDDVIQLYEGVLPTLSRSMDEARFDDLARFEEVRLNRAFGWKEVVRLSNRLHDRDVFPNTMVLMASIALSSETTGEQSIEHVREAVARTRALATREPGSSWESTLVRLLRREGEMSNDLGRTDDAVRAFARADEIIDRYPTADPDLPW
jgi:hypothetical protein